MVVAGAGVLDPEPPPNMPPKKPVIAEPVLASVLGADESVACGAGARAACGGAAGAAAGSETAKPALGTEAGVASAAAVAVCHELSGAAAGAGAVTAAGASGAGDDVVPPPNMLGIDMVGIEMLGIVGIEKNEDLGGTVATSTPGFGATGGGAAAEPGA